MESVEETIREFIVGNFLFGDGARMPSDDDSLLEYGIVDSTGILELVFFIESRYGIKIDVDELVPANLDSVRKAARFVGRKTVAVG
jgi:acyl carrier protein